MIWLYFPYQSLFQDASTVPTEPNFIKDKILGLMSHTAILEYIIGFKSFSLLIEFLTLPSLTLTGMSYFLTERKIEYKSINKILLFILSSYALFALSYSVWYLYIDWSLLNFWGFIFTFVMSLAFLPCLLMFRVYIIYEYVFTRLFMPHASRKMNKKYIYWKAITSFGLNTIHLQRWCNHVLRHEIKSNDDINETVCSIKEAIEREKNPLIIKVNDGWSPYAIKGCLEVYGLKSSTYDLKYNGEWGAEAFFEYSEMSFGNRLGFYVNGTKEIATQLKLKFYCNDPENEEVNYEDYIFLCQKFFATAFERQIPNEFKLELKKRKNFKGEYLGKNIKVIFDDWPNSPSDNGFEIMFVIENNDTKFPEY